MAANGYPANGQEPTMSDVMAMLKAINSKVGGDRSLSRSPRPRTKDPDAPPPLAPLDGSWASTTVIERVLYPRAQIEERVNQLAKKISEDYAGSKEDGFVMVGLMAGVYMFMADLSRNITVPHQVDFIAAGSYGLGTISSANVKIKKDLEQPIEGKDVLLIDEMCDSGRTMACLKRLLMDRGANSVKVCVLLNKASRREAEVDLDYVGWVCEDEFLVGYGMDWSQRFRSLPDICVVRKSAYQKAGA